MWQVAQMAHALASLPHCQSYILIIPIVLREDDNKVSAKQKLAPGITVVVCILNDF